MPHDRPTLAVLGSLVHDTLHRWPPGQAPLEAWGGVAYALAALEAALDEGWAQRLLVKVGDDLQAAAGELLNQWPRTCRDAAFVVVPGVPTNRILLRYTGPDEREEHQVAEMPPWTQQELSAGLLGVSALYLNLASGFELEVATAEALRTRFEGGIYLDLHSLNLGLEANGRRFLRRPPELERWLSCVDVVQVNQAEAALCGPVPEGILAVAEAAGVGAVVVTGGRDGASVWTQDGWRFGARGAVGQPYRETAVVAVRPEEATDPTGCGDVFGAALAASLAGGASVAEAVGRANGLASAASRFSGASGLAAWLLSG